MRRAKVQTVGFLRDGSGATAVEFAIVAMLFMGLMLAIVDLARLSWEMNSAKAAARVGVRYLVVREMLPTSLEGYNAFEQEHVTGNGQSVPVGLIPLYTCTGKALECKPATVTKAFQPNSIDNSSGSTFNLLVSLMQRYYGRVSADNVVVTYKHVGVGVAGNPCAPDIEPLVTVSLTDLSFQPIALRLFGQFSIPIPPARSSMTGESLGRSEC